MRYIVVFLFSFIVFISCKEKVKQESRNDIEKKEYSIPEVVSSTKAKTDISNGELLRRAYELNFRASESLFNAKLSEVKIDILRANYDDAFSKIDRLLEEYGPRPEIYFIKGEVYFAKNEYQKAMNEFRKAVENGKRDVEIYSSMSKASFELGNIDDALRYISKAIEMKSYDRSLRYERANIYEAKKDYKKAIDDYRFIYDIEKDEDVKRSLKEKIVSLERNIRK